MPDMAHTTRKISKRACFFCCALAMLGLLGSYSDLSLDAAMIEGYPVIARWLARGVSLFVYAAAFLMACVRGSLLRRPLVLAGGGILLIVGTMLTFGWAESYPTFLASQVFVGLGSALVLMAWAELLSRLPRSQRTLNIIFGAMGATVFHVLYRLLGGELDGLLSQGIYLVILVGAVVPLLGGAKLWGNGSSMAFCPTAPTADGITEVETSKMSAACSRSVFLPPIQAVSWEHVLLMVCYALLFRILQNFEVEGGILGPVVRFFVTMTALVALLVYIRRGGRKLIDSNGAVLFLFVLVAAGLSLIPFSDDALRVGASSIAGSCWPLFYYLLWIILFDLGDMRDDLHVVALVGAGETDNASRRTAVDPFQTFTWGWLVLNIALILAAPLAWLLAQQVDRGTLSMTALVIILIYTILVASLLIRHRRKAFAVEERVVDHVAGAGTAGVAGVEVRCALLAEQGGLTGREAEVLALLARGRSVPFISDSLGISASTVKGHVKHVYAKLDVSSKQELIDLVEARK